MELSERAIKVLKNFSTINKSIKIYPGAQIKTRSVSRTIMAEANVDVEFPTEFRIYDLPRFLGTLSLFPESPQLDIDHRRIMMTSGPTKITYNCAEDERILDEPEMPVPDIRIRFTLTDVVIKALTKAAGVLGLPALFVTADGEVLKVGSYDPNKKVEDRFTFEVGPTKEVCDITILLDNMKLLPSDYSVEVGVASGKKLSRFIGVDFPVTYWIAVDKNSKFS